MVGTSRAFCLGVLCVTILAPVPGRGQSTETKALYARAQSALKSGDRKLAMKEYEAILRIDPTNAGIHANVGVLDFNNGSFQEAETSFTAAVHFDPSLWDAHAFLALTKLRLGKPDEARTLLEHSFDHLMNDPLRSQAGVELAQIYQRQGEPLKAVRILSDLQQGHTADPDVLYLSYRIYSDLAAQSVSQILNTAPDSAAVHLVKAQAFLTDNDYKNAIREDREALKVNPGLSGIHLEIGRAILADKQDESSLSEAQKEFEEESKSNPSDAGSAYELGEIALMRSDASLAHVEFKRALELQQDYVDAQIGLGKALLALDLPQEASEWLSKAVRSDPDNDVAHYRLALAYRATGQNQLAGREMEIFKQLRNRHAQRALTSPQSVPDVSDAPRGATP